MTWEIRIIESDTGRIERILKCSGERVAEQIERGVLINLNRDKYHTEVIDTQREQFKGGAS